jgi:type VI secretion system protein ImpK
MNDNILKIIGIFSNIVTYTKIIVSNSQEFQFEETKDNYINIINTINHELKEKGFDKKLSKIFLLAYIAWIDEQILSSGINFKNNWMKQSLQKKYFQTSNLGNDFFIQYDNFNTEDKELKLIYIYILCLGFKGKYLMKNDELKIFIKQELEKYNKNLELDYFQDIFDSKENIATPKKKFFFFKINYIIFALLISISFILGMNYFLDKKIITINNKFENIR